MEPVSPEQIRRLRRRIVQASLIHPPSLRQAYSVLRFACNLGLLSHTWIDGQRAELPGPAPLAPFFAELEALGERALKILEPEVALAMAQRHLGLIHAAERWAKRHWNAAAVNRETGAAKLAIALGGGGGASYIGLGAVDLLDGMGIHPSLLAGASMGSILCAFRARELNYQVESVIEETSDLRADTVMGVSTMKNHYSIPATIRLTLQSALGPFFRNDDGFGMKISDMAIPLRVVVSGLVGDPPRDLDFYQHLLDRSWTGRSVRRLVFNFTRLASEFVFGSTVLSTVALGADELSSGLNVVDAIGFSSSIPGVIHYDVERHDDDAHARITEIMHRQGISRILDGGFSENVPALTCRSALASGVTGQMHTLVLGLDGFASNLLHQPLWVPAQQLLRGQIGRAKMAADHWHSFRQPLSPLKLLPGQHTMRAILQAGREEFATVAAEVQHALEDPRPDYLDFKRRLTRA
jgi:predicted acylesterase/phospholipase RssA